MQEEHCNFTSNFTNNISRAKSYHMSHLHYGDVGRSFWVFIGVSFFSVKVMWLLITIPRHRRTFTNLLILQKVYIKALTLDKKAFISSKTKLSHWSYWLALISTQILQQQLWNSQIRWRLSKMAVLDNLKRAKRLLKTPLVVNSPTNGCPYNGIDFLVVESNGSLT